MRGAQMEKRRIGRPAKVARDNDDSDADLNGLNPGLMMKTAFRIALK